ncbi:MAG: 30S ribosomal protein S20 [Acidobacteriota bacterium]|jgi:small subunit ribosomal protein S20
MANHASAIKAHRQSLVRKNRNRSNRSSLRTALKAFSEKLDAGNHADSQASLPRLYSDVDCAVRKGVLSKNAAARHKSRLSKHLNSAAAAAHGK